MREFLGETGLFLYATANHVFGMMYWIWFPGLVVSGYLWLRWHHVLAAALLERQRERESSPAWLTALLLGITGSPDRGTSLDEARHLVSRGAGARSVLLHLVASQQLAPYALAFLVTNLGLEFFLGQLLGALAMALVASGLVRLVPDDRWEQARKAQAWATTDEPRLLTGGMPSRPMRGILRYLAGEVRVLWKGVVVGLVLAGLIGAAGRTDWWPDLGKVGGGGFWTALLNAVAGAALALVFFAAPIGHQLVGTMLWKAYTLTFPGIVAFFLATLANPRAIRHYCRMYGAGLGLYLGGIFLVSAAIGALFVAGLFWVVGFEVTHVPRFHEIVNEIMIFFSVFGKTM
ncbi:MAG: permease [Deltaproteobacteria bacterium]|nr:permease [Deltaproteobacteria bacterium]